MALLERRSKDVEGVVRELRLEPRQGENQRVYTIRLVEGGEYQTFDSEVHGVSGPLNPGDHVVLKVTEMKLGQSILSQANKVRILERGGFYPS